MSKKLRPFQLLVKPTSFDCNLRCRYCFYLKTERLYPEEGRHLMSPELCEEMIKSYLALGFPVSVFIWQGGEPSLCGLDFFEKVVEWERRYASSGQSIGNAFQTNGWLITEEWAEFFSRNNFLVGLSLDGPEGIHNHFRKTPSGQGSFDRVWNALGLLQKKGVEFNILAMVTKENAGKAQEIYRFFREAGLSYLQFIPALGIEEGSGRLAWFSPTSEQYQEFLLEMFELWWQDRNLVSIRDFNWLLSPNLKDRLCIFSETCADYLVIEYNGEIFPCDFFVREEFRLGKIQERNSLTKHFFNRAQSFAPRKKWLSKSCRECAWLRFCYGGCLREREPKDNPDPKKSIYCPAYARLFEYAFKKIKQGSRAS